MIERTFSKKFTLQFILMPGMIAFYTKLNRMCDSVSTREKAMCNSVPSSFITCCFDKLDAIYCCLFKINLRALNNCNIRSKQLWTVQVK